MRAAGIAVLAHCSVTYCKQSSCQNDSYPISHSRSGPAQADGIFAPHGAKEQRESSSAPAASPLQGAFPKNRRPKAQYFLITLVISI
jgi:hypothetical protein